MTVENWISILTLVVDFLKSIIPFVFIFIIFWLFRKELKVLIKNGGWKFSGPGVSVEAANQKVSTKEKKEILALSNELDTTKKAKDKLQELQEYTARDKDTFFLGYHFEKTYRIIFPSQMMVLSYIQTFSSLSEAVIISIFSRTIWAVNLNIPFEHYIGFLINSGLLLEDRQKKQYTLTPLGKLFLQYLQENNIPNKLPANDIIVSDTPQGITA